MTKKQNQKQANEKLIVPNAKKDQSNWGSDAAGSVCNTSIVVVVTLLYTLVKLIELYTKKGEFYCIIITWSPWFFKKVAFLYTYKKLEETKNRTKNHMALECWTIGQLR